MKHVQTGLLAATPFVVALLFWVLSDISAWLVVDSYALDAFPKAHPFLGALAQFFWVADSFGGRYLLIVLLVVMWRLTASLKKRGRNDV